MVASASSGFTLQTTAGFRILRAQPVKFDTLRLMAVKVEIGLDFLFFLTAGLWGFAGRR